MCNWLATRTSRFFSAKIISSQSVPNLYIAWFFPLYRTWHLPLLNIMRFLSVHFSRLSRSLWRAYLRKINKDIQELVEMQKKITSCTVQGIASTKTYLNQKLWNQLHVILYWHRIIIQVMISSPVQLCSHVQMSHIVCRVGWPDCVFWTTFFTLGEKT